MPRDALSHGRLRRPLAAPGLAFLAIAGLAPGLASGATYCRSSVALAIPDNAPAGVSDDLVIADVASVTDLNLSIVATHTWVGDLVFSLEKTAGAGAPLGPFVVIDRPGYPSTLFGCSQDDVDITLDDEALAIGNVEAKCESPLGVGGPYKPSPIALSMFDGIGSDGTWRLTVSDNSAGDGGGVLDDWCLEVNGPEVPTATPTVTRTPQPTVTPTPPLPGGYCTSSEPLAIPDNSAAGVTSDLVVGDSVLLTDLNVSILAQHSFVGDLVFTLEKTAGDGAPLGPVVLMDRPGVPPSSIGCSLNNVYLTLDDDLGGPVEDQCESPLGVGGPYTPNQPLTAFDGINLNGTWRLKVSDLSPQDTGYLLEWCLQENVVPPTSTPTASPTPSLTVPEIPTLSGTGIAIFALLFLGLGVVVLLRTRG